MKKTIWLLLDNRIGSKNQALGIAYYLDKNKFEIIEKTKLIINNGIMKKLKKSAT